MHLSKPIPYERFALVLAGLVWFAAACDNLVDDRNPFAPTPQPVIVSPASTTLAPGGTVTFSAINVATPLTWSVSNTSLASINSSTGALTAGTTPGVVTVTVVDADGKTGTATVVIAQAVILVTPNTVTLTTQPVTSPDFDATGNVGTVTFSLSGASGGYTGATIDATTGVVTITAMPTLAQGNQNLTVRAEDGIATAGTATLTLIAS